MQRIGDTVGEAAIHSNLGHAYLTDPAIRDLDAAEAAYRRSLDMWAKDDLLNRSKCIKQIGMVHQERFREARQRSEPDEAVLRRAPAYAQASLRDFQHYQGRAAADEAKAQQLIDDIGQELRE